MPNELQSTESGAGLLKNYYDTGDTPITEALRKKRKSLADTKRQAEPPGQDDEAEQ